LETDLTELKSLSEYWHRLFNPQDEPNKDIAKHFSYIKQIEISTSYPFLMQVYADYEKKEIDKQTFISVLEFVQAYVWRRFICGNNTAGLNKVFRTLYEKVNKDDYLRSVQRAIIDLKGTIRFPSDSEVRNALKIKDVYNIHTGNSFYLFERLENYNNNEQVTLPNDNLTREHIFPQHPDAGWNNDLSKEEQSDISENDLHTLGNLTLSGNNETLGNKTFLEKQNMNIENKEQGYKFSRLWLNRDLQEIKIWNKEQIEKRTERLTERFLLIWQYPDLPKVFYKECNIFDADDPTYKDIEYVKWKGKELKFKGGFKGLYLKLVCELFEKNADKFLHTQLKNKLKIFKKGEKEYVRKTADLPDGYKFCVSLDAKAIFDRLKSILKELDLRDSLQVKFRDK
jgi:hypothetical protein